MTAPLKTSSQLRTLMILGRVSNLPTVWSNCLAGWLLTGQPVDGSFGMLLTGATCLYTGGLFLNDVCDLEFDRTHHPDRPIPGGQISWQRVAVLGWILLGSGIGFISLLNRQAAGVSLFLTAAILAYNWLHKRWPPALGLMAVCRATLYWLAAAAATGAASATLLPSLGLGGYVLGISLIARNEAQPGLILRWPVGLLLLPLPFAVWHSSASAMPQTVIAGLLLLGWLARTMISPRTSAPTTGRVVGKLLAGIVLVDLLLVASVAGPYWSFSIFAVILALALLLQRRVPAT